MKNIRCAALCCALVVCSAAPADDRHGLPREASFTTAAITPLAIEGLTADAAGSLYTTGRATPPALCPVWRIAAGSLTVVGLIPNPAAPAPACNPSGIAFDSTGKLYIADGGPAVVWTLTPDSSAPPTGTAFATGVPGTNGLAFDADGNLWTGDATTGQGRVWRIGAAGGDCAMSIGCEEAFRIQPMANVLDPLVAEGVANVGRDARTLPPGTINAARQASNTAGSQPLVANGLAFTREGDLYVADTARGAIWKVEIGRHGDVKSRMGCDSTFTANTLCLDAVFVAHPYLEGTDGIALDRAGNIWNSVNERNAIVVVTRDRRVVEIFRNPVNAKGLRNTGPLEFPTSPVLVGKKLCTANSDGDRRDNSPRAAGEINAGGPVGARGKISCTDLP